MTNYAATILRLALAIMYLAHAGLKLFVYTLPGTAQFFEGHGFPGWSAYAVVPAEILAGLLLLVGWHTRMVALALIPVLLGALTVHWGNGWVFTATGGGWEYPLFLVVVSIVSALLGDGAYAIARGRSVLPGPAL